MVINRTIPDATAARLNFYVNARPDSYFPKVYSDKGPYHTLQYENKRVLPFEIISVLLRWRQHLPTYSVSEGWGLGLSKTGLLGCAPATACTNYRHKMASVVDNILSSDITTTVGQKPWPSS